MENKNVFINYVRENKACLAFLLLLFAIGVMLGIGFINDANEVQTAEIGSYVNSLKENIKVSDHINKTVVLKQSLKQNVTSVLIIWILGCTLLGSFLIYGIVLYKGFSIGYTAAAIIATLGTKSRNDFYFIFFTFAEFSFFTSNFYVI